MTDEPSTTPTKAPDEARKPSRRSWPFWLGGLLLALITWNATVTITVASAHSGEDTHTLVAYRRWLVSPDQIVLDVWKADPASSMADMDRLLYRTGLGDRAGAQRSLQLGHRLTVVTHEGLERHGEGTSVFEDAGLRVRPEVLHIHVHGAGPFVPPIVLPEA